MSAKQGSHQWINCVMHIFTGYKTMDSTNWMEEYHLTKMSQLQITMRKRAITLIQDIIH